MKKILNKPEKYVDEMLDGIYIAHSDKIKYVGNDRHCLVRKNKMPGKVGIATGGGSGHLPLFLGYVGDGLLDGCTVGEVFQSPSAEQMLAVTKEIDAGAGVLYIYGNYNGDIFNFDMAAEMADFECDIEVQTVLGTDDIVAPLPENPGDKNTRRGVAGIVFVYKCAGAAAKAMNSLEEVKRIAQKTADNVRTLGVALSPCTVPRIGHPGFYLGEDEMEIGMGIHGETGIRREKIQSADEIVQQIMDRIFAEPIYKSGDEVAILVNGLGATTLDEQYICVRKIEEYLKKKKITPYRYYVGEYVTSLEMAGLSISVLKLDDELKKYMDEPACPFLFPAF